MSGMKNGVGVPKTTRPGWASGEALSARVKLTHLKRLLPPKKLTRRRGVHSKPRLKKRRPLCGGPPPGRSGAAKFFIFGGAARPACRGHGGRVSMSQPRSYRALIVLTETPRKRIIDAIQKSQGGLKTSS